MTLNSFILFADYEGLAKLGLVVSNFVLLIEAVAILVAIFFKAFRSTVAVVLSGMISLVCWAIAGFSYWDFSRLPFAGSSQAWRRCFGQWGFSWFLSGLLHGFSIL